MHQFLHILVVVSILALFVAIIINLHLADVRATDKPEVKVCHASCAYVELSTGKVRTVEPGFAEFCLEGLMNKFTTDGSPSRLHLQSEPV
jgi:hypothetical protein